MTITHSKPASSTNHDVSNLDSSSVVLPGCILQLKPNWLFERMKAKGEGWHIKSEAADIWPSLGVLDSTMIEAIHRASARPGTMLAIGVPKVVTGLTLGPLIYTVLNLLVQNNYNYISPSGFTPLPFYLGNNIALVSRSHEIRDLLAESLLRFGNNQTKLCQFPTYRLDHKGALAAGAYGRLPRHLIPRPQDMVQKPISIVVYDYWPYPYNIKLPTMQAVFAELAEGDSSEVVVRLHDFITRTQAKFAFVVLNMGDSEKRQQLEDMGFQFMAVCSEDNSNSELAPSFTSVNRVAPTNINVTFEALTDSPITKSLADSFKLLTKLHNRIREGEEYPAPLQRAWYILNQLTSCPAPLLRYEKGRRDDPRERSLSFNLERMAQVNWNQIPEWQRSWLMLYWPDVVEHLNRAYQELEKANPKWWRLAEIALYSETPTTFLLPTRTAAQAMRDELLVGLGWSEEQSQVRVTCLANVRRSGERFDHIILAGNWKDWQRPIIFGTLPREVQVVGYPHEALVLDKQLEAMRIDLEVTLAEHTATTIQRLFPIGAAQSHRNLSKPLSWNTEMIAATRSSTIRRWRAEEAAAQQELNEELDWDSDQSFARVARLAIGHEYASSNDSENDTDDESDEEVLALTIGFAGGGHCVVRADRELLVVSGEEQQAQQIFASEVRVGDQLLMFSTGEQHDVFALVLERTHHLMNTDPLIIERWHATLVALRDKYPVTVRGMRTRFCEALEAQGCHRNPVTMRGWLSGSAMAPDDEVDIAHMLSHSGLERDVQRWAKLISREMNQVRNFNRRIGRRIISRILSHGDGEPARNRIDQEIDELLEDTELRKVAAVSTVALKPKRQLVIFKEDDF